MSQATSAKLDLDRILPVFATTTMELLRVRSCTITVWPGAQECVFTAPDGASVFDSPVAIQSPIRAGDRVVGNIYVVPHLRQALQAPELRLLETLASQAALVIERSSLVRQAAAAQALAESDRLKSILLSSVSHDLRTPLVAIKGIATALHEHDVAWDSTAGEQMLETLASRRCRPVIQCGDADQSPNRAASDMTNARILVVDDEPQIRRFLKITLEVRGYEVALAETGREALEQVTGWRPDVVLLDLGLPIMDGLEVCRRVREWSDVPIIVLTVRDREEDKVMALNTGADDYLTKPFGTGELLARIQVALRHAAGLTMPQDPIISAGELQINLSLRQITRRGEPVHLTPTEYELLRILATSGGKVLTHTMLLQKVWGPDQQQDAAKLRVFVNQLRRKIEDDPAQPRYIVTEPGVGYRFHID